MSHLMFADTVLVEDLSKKLVPETGRLCERKVESRF